MMRPMRSCGAATSLLGQAFVLLLSQSLSPSSFVGAAHIVRPTRYANICQALGAGEKPEEIDRLLNQDRGLATSVNECRIYGEPVLVAALGSCFRSTSSQCDERLRESLVRILVAHGADVNVKLAKTWTTPLMLAARNGTAALLQLLIDEGADVNARNKRRVTALMRAAGSEGKEGPAKVRALLAAKAEIQAVDAEKRTALMEAVGVYRVESCQNESALVLLDAPGGSSLEVRGARDDAGETAEFYATFMERDAAKGACPCSEEVVRRLALTRLEQYALVFHSWQVYAALLASTCAAGIGSALFIRMEAESPCADVAELSWSRGAVCQVVKKRVRSGRRHLIELFRILDVLYNTVLPMLLMLCTWRPWAYLPVMAALYCLPRAASGGAWSLFHPPPALMFSVTQRCLLHDTRAWSRSDVLALLYNLARPWLPSLLLLFVLFLPNGDEMLDALQNSTGAVAVEKLVSIAETERGSAATSGFIANALPVVLSTALLALFCFPLCACVCLPCCTGRCSAGSAAASTLRFSNRSFDGGVDAGEVLATAKEVEMAIKRRSFGMVREKTVQVKVCRLLPPGGFYFKAAFVYLDVVLDLCTLNTLLLHQDFCFATIIASISLGSLLVEVRTGALQRFWGELTASIEAGVPTDGFLAAVDRETGVEAMVSLFLTSYSLPFAVQTKSQLFMGTLSILFSALGLSSYLHQRLDIEALASTSRHDQLHTCNALRSGEAVVDSECASRSAVEMADIGADKSAHEKK